MLLQVVARHRENELKAAVWEFTVTKRKNFLITKVLKRSIESFLKEDFKNRSAFHLPGMI